MHQLQRSRVLIQSHVFVVTVVRVDMCRIGLSLKVSADSCFGWCHLFIYIIYLYTYIYIYIIYIFIYVYTYVYIYIYVSKPRP